MASGEATRSRIRGKGLVASYSAHRLDIREKKTRRQPAMEVAGSVEVRVGEIRSVAGGLNFGQVLCPTQVKELSAANDPL
jgi:hypothetical protein